MGFGYIRRRCTSNPKHSSATLSIINSGSEPVTIRSMGFEGSGTNKKFGLDYLNTWQAPTEAELPRRRGEDNEPVLFVSKVTTATFTNTPSRRYRNYPPTSAITATPSAIGRFGGPNRPTVRETKSRETVLRRGGRPRGVRD
jgi:hypothetical protein